MTLDEDDIAPIVDLDDQIVVKANPNIAALPAREYSERDQGNGGAGRKSIDHLLLRANRIKPLMQGGTAANAASFAALEIQRIKDIEPSIQAKLVAGLRIAIGDSVNNASLRR